MTRIFISLKKEKLKNILKEQGLVKDKPNYAYLKKGKHLTRFNSLHQHQISKNINPLEYRRLCKYPHLNFIRLFESCLLIMKKFVS